MSEDPADISLLHDLFVACQRVSRVVAVTLAESPLRGEEYAVYSVLFANGPLTATELSRGLGMALTSVLNHLRAMEARRHLRREPHPRDGRAQHLSLTFRGLRAWRATNRAWDPMIRSLESALPVPVGEVRRSLRSLNSAAEASLRDLAGHGR